MKKATAVYRAAPDDLARFGFAVAQALDASATRGNRDSPTIVLALARQVADALRQARRPVVISGGSCGSPTVVQAAANVAWALRKANVAGELCYTVPGVQQPRDWRSWAARRLTMPSLRCARQQADTVIVLEERSLPPARWRHGRSESSPHARQVIVLDQPEDRPLRARATAVLPAATFAEANRHAGE